MRCQGSATHLLKKATHFLRNCVTMSVKPATKPVVVLFYYLFKCLKHWANGRQVRIEKSSEPRPRGGRQKPRPQWTRWLCCLFPCYEGMLRILSIISQRHVKKTKSKNKTKRGKKASLRVLDYLEKMPSVVFTWLFRSNLWLSRPCFAAQAKTWMTLSQEWVSAQ